MSPQAHRAPVREGPHRPLSFHPGSSLLCSTLHIPDTKTFFSPQEVIFSLSQGLCTGVHVLLSRMFSQQSQHTPLSLDSSYPPLHHQDLPEAASGGPLIYVRLVTSSSISLEHLSQPVIEHPLLRDKLSSLFLEHFFQPAIKPPLVRLFLKYCLYT